MSINLAELEQEAHEYYDEQMRKYGGCYRPTTGQEPRLTWLLASFAMKVIREAENTIEDVNSKND